MAELSWPWLLAVSAAGILAIAHGTVADMAEKVRIIDQFENERIIVMSEVGEDQAVRFQNGHG